MNSKKPKQQIDTVLYAKVIFSFLLSIIGIITAKSIVL